MGAHDDSGYRPEHVPKPWGHETIRVLSGTLRLEVGREGEPSRVVELGPGEGWHITAGLRHRMVAVADTDVLEVSTPELDDVVRLDDRYGRVK